MNRVLFHSRYFAWGGCHEQMYLYKSESHHYCLQVMKIVQIRPPALTCRWMIISQLCFLWLTLPPFDLVKWPHWFQLIPLAVRLKRAHVLKDVLLRCDCKGWFEPLTTFLHGLFTLLLLYYEFKAVKSWRCLYYLTFCPVFRNVD